MVALAVVTCPCHLPLLLAVLAGTSTGAWPVEYQVPDRFLVTYGSTLSDVPQACKKSVTTLGYGIRNGRVNVMGSNHINGQAIVMCPVSGTKGKLVKTVTLRSLIKEEQQHRITEGRYWFCDAQECDVVYFAEDGSHIFTKADLKVRVGVKETEAPRPICYCFNHTVEEIFDEIQRTGTTTIPNDIANRLNSEGCDCVHTNPQGSCCLGVVNAFVKEGMLRFGPTQGKACQTEKCDLNSEDCCK